MLNPRFPGNSLAITTWVRCEIVNVNKVNEEEDVQSAAARPNYLEEKETKGPTYLTFGGGSPRVLAKADPKVKALG